MKKKKIIYIPLLALGGVIVTVLSLIGALNLLKFAIYHDYYSIEKSVAKIPGIDDSFVMQGLTLLDDESQTIAIGGYTSNKTASRIYITNPQNEVRKITFTDNGEPFLGHSGGIAISNDTFYLANGDGRGSGVYMLDASKIKDPSTTELELERDKTFKEVEGSASFVFANDDYLYIGEFHDGGKYVTNHPLTTRSGKEYKAIVRKYALDDKELANPICYYSIPNKVQGFAIMKDGDIALSTSYGLSSSYYYVYKEKDIYLSDTKIDGVDTYVLDNAAITLKAPAMSEDLDFNPTNNRLYIVTEAASNKYIFGKFFNAYDINSLGFYNE